ncbi:MAG: tripartite tricarboxylate transporter substrate-binding protein [Ramlibacter sp.]|uniref:Bug family tripartite tricarboxylate transporter substrate binding protein n=1 Tax=Ramlibacter sp. TaxID=1917967 RepID=UPI002606F151|nr:tripartite tricarboxylate transporter substrate-binding protein [Ramlibacter sp.]MDH4376632.1 tripartite tricarboxylate transporter substrate-binding protein [Ramlibacter sp.]
MNRTFTRLTQVLLATLLCTAAWAQTDAERIPATIKLVVPFAPRGSNDVNARAIAPGLAKRLGTTIIIDNKPGAAGSIGADAVAKGPKDGSILLLTSSTLVTSAATMPRTTPFDVNTAFAPLALIGQGPMLLAVSATTPIKTPADFVAAARSNPGAISYGTSGPGSIAHMSSEMLAEAAKIQMLHVPYKGAAPALLDLASGQIQMMVSNYSSIVAQIKAGRVRPLAVTSRTASPSFPDLPPMGNLAPGFSAEIWVAVFAPAGTPAALVQRLNREINEAARQPEVKALLEADGTLPVALPPAEVAARIREDFAAWKKIAVAKNISAE